MTMIPMGRVRQQPAMGRAGMGDSKRMVSKAKGGSVSASKRADGCATKGKTKGKMV